MSMHLSGHGLTTNSTRRRHSSVVINAKFREEFHEHNRFLKRMGSKKKTFVEYVDYRQGNTSYKQRVAKIEEKPYQRPSPKVPSGMGIGVANTKKDEKVYTGDKLMGIATMHKSNMVPVFKQEDAEDISKMSR